MNESFDKDIKTIWFKARWWTTLSLNWLFSLIWAKEVAFLVGVVGVLFGIGWLCTGSKSEAFRCLFDAGSATQNFKTGIIFFVTWLVGGGVLVSVMISQYYRLIGGCFRRWTWLVRNHIVVLGWDDGMLMEIRKMVEKHSADCYIITQKDAVELRKSLRQAGLERVIVYRGQYDSEDEWGKKLRIDRAAFLFICGEEGEDAHDARVKLLYDKIMKAQTRPQVKVNLCDFGLAWKMMKRNSDFENFHVKWAEAFWRFLKTKKHWADACCPHTVDVFIVGFGAMGKAIALTARDIAATVKVIATDDDAKKLAEEEDRYKNQFGTTKAVQDFRDWNTVLSEIAKDDSNSGESRVVVVVKKKSEKGMLCMMDVIARFPQGVPHDLTLAISQEITGYDGGGEPVDVEIGNEQVILFGMKRGC